MAEEVAPKKQQAHVFVWLHAVYARGNSLPTRAHALAAALVLHADADGTSCFPSAPHLAEHLNLSRHSVYRAARELERAGLLERRNSESGGPTMWLLLVPDDAVVSCRDSMADPDEGVAPLQQAVAPLQQGCCSGAHVPAHGSAHGPAQDLAGARSDPDGSQTRPPESDHDWDGDHTDMRRSRDLLGGEWTMQESAMVQNMLEKGEPVEKAVNTIRKRRRAEDEQQAASAVDAEPPPEGFEPPPEPDTLPPDDVDQAVVAFKRQCEEADGVEAWVEGQNILGLPA